MGLEKLTNAFGILMLFQGLAAVMGGPIAGKFRFSNSMRSKFYFAVSPPQACYTMQHKVSIIRSILLVR